MQPVRQRRRIDNPEPNRAVRSGGVLESREQRLDVRAFVVVVHGPDRRPIHQHADRRSVNRNQLRLRRQCPPEVHKTRAGDDAALRRRVDRAERLRRARICARHRPSPEQPGVPIPVLRIHEEQIRPVALRGQHIGQDHESPPGPGVHRHHGIRRLDVGPRAVDEHGEAHEHLRGPRAVRIHRRHFRPEGRPADHHPRYLDVIERPPGERHGASHPGRVLQRRVYDAFRRRRGPVEKEREGHVDRAWRVGRADERQSDRPRHDPAGRQPADRYHTERQVRGPAPGRRESPAARGHSRWPSMSLCLPRPWSGGRSAAPSARETRPRWSPPRTEATSCRATSSGPRGSTGR